MSTMPPELTADAAEKVTAEDLEILDELLEMSPALELGLFIGGSWTRSHTARLRDLRGSPSPASDSEGNGCCR